MKESNTEAFCLWSCYLTYLDTAALLCKAILVKDNTVLYIILYPDEISDIFVSQNKIEKKVNCKKKVITKYLTQMFQASNNQTYFHRNHQKLYLPKPENFLNKEKNFQKTITETSVNSFSTLIEDLCISTGTSLCLYINNRKSHFKKVICSRLYLIYYVKWKNVDSKTHITYITLQLTTTFIELYIEYIEFQKILWLCQFIFSAAENAVCRSYGNNSYSSI